MSDGPEIRVLAPQRAAIRCERTGRDGIGETIDAGFGALFAELGKAGVVPADAPYIRYLKTGEQLEIELGIPVAAGAALDGIGDGTLPSGRAGVLRHVGPYEQLREAAERLLAWLGERGERPGGPHWESYVTNPAREPDPARRITDTYVPLA